MSLRHTLFALAAFATSATLVGCHNDELPGATESTAPVPVGDTVVLSASGKVLTFNRASLSSLVSSVTIKGLASGEAFVGIDVRPQDSLIYGVTNQGNLYTLDDSTGKVTLKFALSAGAATDRTCTGGAPGLFTALSGTEFAVDFNPMADRLRVASDTRQNLRINVADGKVIVDCPITFAAGASGTPKPTAAAYTNSIPGMTATTTRLFYIDSGDDMVYTIDTSTNDAGTMMPTNANNGILTPVGALGVNAGDVNGFDIEGSTSTGFAVLTVNGVTGFYRLDSSTGAATVQVNFPAGEVLRGLSLK
ncbi:MAG: DUF4394 domain-containing protein [Pseudomonadota bacterium]